jgi:hypothetical protein
MARNIEVSTYLPPSEAVDVEDAAADAGLSVSKYIRSHIPECDIDE